jgi:hypothetical protein
MPPVPAGQTVVAAAAAAVMDVSIENHKMYLLQQQLHKGCVLLMHSRVPTKMLIISCHHAMCSLLNQARMAAVTMCRLYCRHIVVQPSGHRQLLSHV